MTAEQSKELLLSVQGLKKNFGEREILKGIDFDVHKGDVVCVVEAMKLFNEIESEISGKIVKVLVEHSTPVEYDQPLFLIDPS